MANTPSNNVVTGVTFGIPKLSGLEHFILSIVQELHEPLNPRRIYAIIHNIPDATFLTPEQEIYSIEAIAKALYALRRTRLIDLAGQHWQLTQKGHLTLKKSDDEMADQLEQMFSR